MPDVKVGKDESLESAIRRFRRDCQRAGVMQEMRKREHYLSPSMRRKKKSQAAKRKRPRDH